MNEVPNPPQENNNSETADAPQVGSSGNEAENPCLRDPAMVGGESPGDIPGWGQEYPELEESLYIMHPQPYPAYPLEDGGLQKEGNTNLK